MDTNNLIASISTDLLALGLRPGGVLLVHSSFKALGQVPGGAETVIQRLLAALGANGTLLMPALTYETVRSNNPIFNLHTTPSCVGIIPETFRLREGTRRSLHPTHSVCGVGPLAEELLALHAQDTTPVGPNSPFRRIADFDGQILMLGCGLLPNTAMHGIEEMAAVPYVLKEPMVYTLFDEQGQKIEKAYQPHNFKDLSQRYDRVAEVLPEPDLRTGKVLAATCYLLDTRALQETALKALHKNPLFFVDQITER